ncbi:MAG: PHP domain-containing protein, partial [Treponema sp.]|nr:PHP domain-containing protein [Treponema sp.]
MPGKLLDRAISLGAGTVSICDINNLYGVHNFLEEAKEKKIKPVIGTALTRNEKRVYCFVEDKNGFARLCEILTERSKDKDNFNPLKFLREDSSGLVLASANYEILSELSGRVKKLYAAITADSLEGIEAHKKMSLPLAFLDTSLFLEKDDYFVHKVLRAIGLNKTTGSLAPCDTVKSGEGLLKSEKELTSILYSWPEAARGSAEIAAACGFNELFNSFIFPSYGENPFMELRRRVFPGAVERYGELGDTEIDRIEYELDIIEKTGFSAYFLRMDDIVKMAGTGNTRNICGRGSGAASIVSYALGITNVDPIAHNLYFERFLNPARPDPPDIDVDFAWDERDELIKAVIERFGSNYCARVANHNFFKQRSALRETAKAFGFSDGEISGMEKKLETGEVESGIKDEKLWKDILNMAKRIEGLPRGLSMHCGGLVITPEPVCRYAPVEKSLEGFPLLAWEKEGTEARGFVKIDLLGNRSLAVIRDALIRLEEEGIIIDRPWRPEEDEPTIGALASGDSIGVFYIESPAMRQLQKKTGAGDFEHIVIHSSLIRPAANKFISEYVRRLKGGKWEPLHPHLESILDETYGILCYQEDVSKTAVALAGFNEAEADKLRKIIAKKAGAAKLAVYRERFAEGCKKNKVDENTIGKVWAMMLSFDGYSFCKPHSASYAMVSFQSAYLRVHYPAEFMAAVISNQGGYYRPGAYISECRRMGLLLEGPDINKSR